MKILLVSHFFPPTHTAGAEKRTVGYAIALQKLGHHVQVVCAGEFDKGKQHWNGYKDDLYQNIPVRRVYLNWKLGSDPNQYLYRNPLIGQYFLEWLKDWQPDLVHITSCYTLSASVIEAAKAWGVPVVLTLTDYWFICPRLSLLRGDGSLCDGRTSAQDCLQCLLWYSKANRWLNQVLPEKAAITILDQVSQHPELNKRQGLLGAALNMSDRKDYLVRMLESVDQVTAPSAHLANVHREAGVSKAINVIKSGHDLLWLKTSPTKILSKPVKFGYVGQITPLKGVHILVSAFANITKSEAQLLIYGDHQQYPHYTQKLKAFVAEKELDVTFSGVFPHERLGEVLSKIDVLVVPSQWHENNPRVIQEAFATKTPVIASNVGGIAEFVQHETNGLLFERDSIDSLTLQFQRIIDEPGMWLKLQKGIPRVKTIAEEVSELDKIYQELVAGEMTR